MSRTCISIVIVLVLLGCASRAAAQQPCSDLRALNTQTFAADPEGNGGWTLLAGTTSGILDWQPVKLNYIEYLPPESGGSAYPSAVAGRYWDFTQTWYFQDANGHEIGTLSVGSYHASFPVPSGKGGAGNFVGNGKITGGTGIFAGASGTVNESGPYLLWFTEDGWMRGSYNASYIARVCFK